MLNVRIKFVVIRCHGQESVATIDVIVVSNLFAFFVVVVDCSAICTNGATGIDKHVGILHPQIILKCSEFFCFVMYLNRIQRFTSLFRNFSVPFVKIQSFNKKSVFQTNFSFKSLIHGRISIVCTVDTKAQKRTSLLILNFT